MTTSKRNRPRLEGRCSPEVPTLVNQLIERVPGANKSDILEMSVRLLAEVFGIAVPMNDQMNIFPMSENVRACVHTRLMEHFDRVRSEYEHARHKASSAGGIAKRENLRNGVTT
jgi:hypothetical protein